MNELALFAGAGGGLLGGRLLGWRTVCAVEIDPYCRRGLFARQRDGMLPWFPIWDDVRTFDGRSWRGKIDVISGGFPCQDISCAGKGTGINGSRSGLWAEFARIIREVAPGFVFVENVPALIRRGLDRVLGDLAEMGYNASWGVLGARDAGAPHRRERIWIVAHADSGRCKEQLQSDGESKRSEQQASLRNHANGCGEAVADGNGTGLEKREGQDTTGTWQDGGAESCGGQWWDAEPDVGRVAHGVAHRVDRLRALGNGQVPDVAALAWRILTEGEFKVKRPTRQELLNQL